MATADGREKTIAASRARLARMVGRDAADADDAAWDALARWFAEAQMRAIIDGAMLVVSAGRVAPDAPVVGAGIGAGIVREIARRLGREYIPFEGLLDVAPEARDAASQCAPAAALALLAAAAMNRLELPARGEVVSGGDCVMSVTNIAEPAQFVRAMPRDMTLGASTAWHRLSLRAKLLLVFILVDLIAALVIGGVTILKARTSTRVEIAASMTLAETLVSEAIGAAQQQSVNSLAAHLPAQRLMRHVRLSVRNAAHLPVAIGPQAAADGARSPAPAWFEALIAPPVERRELPIVSNDQTIGSVLITGVAQDEIAEAWENFAALISVGTGLNIAVIALLYLLFGRVLGPLNGLAKGLGDLEARNYGVRLAQPGSRELGAIADRFNSLAQALASLRAENVDLNRRLITAQDDERRHTALELHDEVGPSLFGLKANATSIVRHAASGDIAERAQDMLAIIDHLQATNRNLLNRLRPMALGDVPLGDLLSEMVRDRARQNGDLQVSFTPGAVHPSYGEAVDLTIYRCVQEGLTNAIRHAQASRIGIALDETGGVLNLQIEDDGCGIGSPMGRGLTGMQERVQALGGRFAIDSRPRNGTSLRIAIPLRGAG